MPCPVRAFRLQVLSYNGTVFTAPLRRGRAGCDTIKRLSLRTTPPLTAGQPPTLGSRQALLGALTGIRRWVTTEARRAYLERRPH
jgi:hypothetical protein